MKNIQVTCPPLAGKSTFAFDYAKRRAISGIHDPDQIGKILALTKYPSAPGQLESLDITVRAKILKAHLEDVFEKNRFSVMIRRYKKSSRLKIVSSGPPIDQTVATSIISLYAEKHKTQGVLRTLKT